MANDFHDPIPFGSPANSNVLNSPLHQLDEALQTANSLLQTLIAGQSRFLISSGTLGADAASWTIASSIAADYLDLELTIKARTTRAIQDDQYFLTINNDTTAADYSGYGSVIRKGDTNPQVEALTKAVEAPGLVFYAPGATATAGLLSDTVIRIRGYTLAFYKAIYVDEYTWYTTADLKSRYIWGGATWLSTSTITRLDIVCNAFANMKAGTQYQLFGIK